MSLLVLVRHGQTQYNLDQRFCGWTDEPLSDVGRETAKVLANKLKNIRFDLVYTSDLSRTSETAKIIIENLNQSGLKIQASQEIKERDYGDLTGRNHSEAAKKFGQDQVDLWRRSWAETPPHRESLKDVYNRVAPFLKTEILPQLQKENKNILIAAHGNSLRATIKYFDLIPDREIAKLEILYDSPYIYKIEKERIEKIDHNPRQFEKIAL